MYSQKSELKFDTLLFKVINGKETAMEHRNQNKSSATDNKTYPNHGSFKRKEKIKI